MAGRSPLPVRLLVLLCSLALAPAGPCQAEPPLPVVTTFSVLADLVRQVGGEYVAVTSLVAAGADPHVHRIRPSDVRAVGNAAMVVANGFGFDHWIQRVMAAASTSATLLVASDGSSPLQPRDLERHAGHGHPVGDVDPHAWHAIGNAAIYVTNIERGLCQAVPAHCSAFRVRARHYRESLVQLDAELRERFSAIDGSARGIVTAHQSLVYLARDMGFEIRAPRGYSSDADASAGDMAALLRAARRGEVVAVFSEQPSDMAFVRVVGEEAGLPYGGRLYVDTLSAPDGPAATYVEMMRHNVATITNALAGRPTGGAGAKLH